jgi:hypothetical protein
VKDLFPVRPYVLHCEPHSSRLVPETWTVPYGHLSRSISPSNGNRACRFSRAGFCARLATYRLSYPFHPSSSHSDLGDRHSNHQNRADGNANDLETGGSMPKERHKKLWIVASRGGYRSWIKHLSADHLAGDFCRLSIAPPSALSQPSAKNRPEQLRCSSNQDRVCPANANHIGHAGGSSTSRGHSQLQSHHTQNH